MDKYSRVVAILSIFIGTAFLIAFYLTGHEGTFWTAGVFIFFAIIINLINVFILTYLIIKRNKKSNKISLIITLANLPIIALYLVLYSYLGMRGTRVTFINVSGSKISNVYITGPESKSIGTMEMDENVSFWMSTTDGSIDIHYVIKGDTITENVHKFYPEPGFNHNFRMSHKIGLKSGE
jgi:hypothetical protein